MSQTARPRAPGRGMLLAASIVLIIFGAIVLLFSLLPLLGAGLTATYSAESVDAALATGVLLIIGIVLLALGMLYLVLGIIGCAKSGKASAGVFYIVVGAILGVLSLCGLVGTFVAPVIASAGVGWWLYAIGVVLAALYIAGGVINKKAAA